MSRYVQIKISITNYLNQGTSLWILGYFQISSFHFYMEFKKKMYFEHDFLLKI